MTLAGTRPPTVDEWDKYELHHRARLATKPGLTGMWQVSGRSNITDLEDNIVVTFYELKDFICRVFGDRQGYDYTLYGVLDYAQYRKRYVDI